MYMDELGFSYIKKENISKIFCLIPKRISYNGEFLLIEGCVRG